MAQAQASIGTLPSHDENVRIGPISIFTLIIVICLAVLAVLAVATSHASLTMAERQATAVTSMYVNESAAQAFLAELDDVLAAREGSAGVEAQLEDLCYAAEDAVGGEVTATASFEDDHVMAQFNHADGRMLEVTVTIRGESTYRIDQWKVTAVQNEEQPQGSLWIAD